MFFQDIFGVLKLWFKIVYEENFTVNPINITDKPICQNTQLTVYKFTLNIVGF